jgi:hypothetical protein
VVKGLMEDDQCSSFDIGSHLLEGRHNEGENYFNHIIIGGKTWFHVCSGSTQHLLY